MRSAILAAAAIGVVALAGAVVFVVTRDASAPSPTTAVMGGTPAGGLAGAPKGGVAADAAAQAMLADAERLLNRGDTPAAKDLYGKARAQYRRQGNAAGEAAAVFGLGKLEHVNGQSDPARVAFSEALTLFRQANDAANQARVLVALGDLEKDTFHGAKAAQHYRASRTLWAVAPDPKSDAHVMLNLDRAPDMPAGEQRARSVIDQADKIFHNIGDKEGEGDVAMALGMLELRLGKQGPAQASFRWARDYYAESGANAKELGALIRIVSAEIWQGYNIAAGEHLREASGLAQGTPISAARVRVQRGDLERLQGRLDAARDEFAAAIPVLAAAGDGEEMGVLLRLGRVQLTLGALDDARQAFESARAAAAARGEGRMEATAVTELGSLLVRSGDAEAARSLLAPAADRMRAMGDAGGEGRALLEVGIAALALRDARGAANAFAASAQRMADARLPFGQLLAQVGLGEAERAAGTLSAGRLAAVVELRRVLTEPVAEAARVLGLPPVETLYYVDGRELPEDGNTPDPVQVRAAQAIRAANLVRYPDAGLEARALLRDTDKRLAALARPAN